MTATMTRTALFTLVAVCASPAMAFDRLSEAAFRAQVVGKTLHYDRGGSLTFAADGSLSGTFPRGAASGVWGWSSGSVCSEIKIGSKAYPRSCRSPETEGNRIRFIAQGGRIFGEATLK